jgi:DNA-binding PadR family transcriptional regulator
MLREGVITEVTNPGNVSLRQRITYQITAKGREDFAAEVTDDGPSAWEDESFNMRFAFFSRTSADVRLRILEGRRSRLQERLDRQRHVLGGDDRYLSELRRHSIESVEREVRWLTDLINAERSTPATPAPTVPSAATTEPGGDTTTTSAAPVADASK